MNKDKLKTLNASEKRTLILISEGKNNSEIAEAMFLSKEAIRSKLRNIYLKLDMSGSQKAKRYRLIVFTLNNINEITGSNE